MNYLFICELCFICELFVFVNYLLFNVFGYGWHVSSQGHKFSWFFDVFGYGWHVPSRGRKFSWFVYAFVQKSWKNQVFRWKLVLIDVFRGSSRFRKMLLEKCYPILVLKLKMDGIKPSLGPSKGCVFGRSREIACFWGSSGSDLGREVAKPLSLLTEIYE